MFETEEIIYTNQPEILLTFDAAQNIVLMDFENDHVNIRPEANNLHNSLNQLQAEVDDPLALQSIPNDLDNFESIENPGTEEVPKSVKSYPCEKKTKSEGRLLKKSGVLTKPYKCTKCSREFNFEINLNFHLLFHNNTPVPGAAYPPCPECGIEFIRKASFHGHLKTHMKSDYFHCKKCDMEFEFIEYYRQHQKLAHKNEATRKEVQSIQKHRPENKRSPVKKYVCKICDKRFPKPSNLRRHEITHSSIKPFECTECNQRFTQKSSLQAHILIHQGSKPFDCSKCSMKFTQRANLLAHIKRAHAKDPNGKENFSCIYCSCVFTKLNVLTRHISQKHPTTTSVQDNDDLSVDDIMAQIKSLQRHTVAESVSKSAENTESIGEQLTKTVEIANSSSEKYQSDDKNEKISCVKLVDNLNPNKEVTYRQVKQICINGTKWYACSHCQKRFKRPIDLLRHTKVHTKEKPYECHICNQRFAIKSTLKNHLNTHKNYKTYSCPLCPKWFNSLRSLDTHAKLHAGCKMFICEICGKLFSTSSNLFAHKRKHLPKTGAEISLKLQDPISKIEENDTSNNDDNENNLRLYQCKDCGVRFKRSTHLKQHEASHLGLKPYQCESCKSCFTTKSSLTFHKKTHTEKRSHQCTKCNASFFKKYDLKRHKLTHIIERNFMCPYCKKDFKSKNTCRQHIRTHEKDLCTKQSVAQIEEAHNTIETIFEHKTVEKSTELNQNDQIQFEYVILVNDPSSTVDLTENQNCSESEQNRFYLDLLQPEQFHVISENKSVFQEQIEKDTLINVPPTASAAASPDNISLEKRLRTEFVEINDLLNENNMLSSNIYVESHSNHEDAISENPEYIETQSVSKSYQDHHSIKETVDNIQENNTKTDDDSMQPKTNEKNTKESRNNYKCDVCEKLFKRPVDLRRHLRTHTMEKPYSCDICLKSFSLKCTLKKHKQTHGIDRTFVVCQVCGKNYSNNSSLQLHLRLHTGERPYQCLYCPKTFRTTGHRNSHAVVHLEKKDAYKVETRRIIYGELCA